MPAPRFPAWPLLAAGLALGLLPRAFFLGPSPSRILDSLRSHRQRGPIALKALDDNSLDAVEVLDAVEFLDSIPAELEGRDKRKHVGQALNGMPALSAGDLAHRCLDQLRPGDLDLAPVFVGKLRKPAASSVTALFSVLDMNMTVGMECLLSAGLQQEHFTGEQRYYLQIVVGELARQEEWHLLAKVVMKWAWLVPDINGEIDAAIVALSKQEEWAKVGPLAEAIGNKPLATECFTKAREATIRKSVANGKPIKGIAAAQRSKAGKRLMLNLLLNEGMADLATELAGRWGQRFDMSNEKLVKESHRKRRHYQLEKKLESELFLVTTEARVQSIAPNLLEAPAVGMDVECQGRKPVLLQLATLDTVYLFDLLQLRDSQVLGSLVAELVDSDRTTFLTFGGKGDLTALAKLGGFWDVMRCTGNNCVELQPEDGIGLSALTEEILGLPLDKSMTASDWAKRPLSLAQKKYAALDAWILLRIYQEQMGGRPEQPPQDKDEKRGKFYREWFSARLGR